MYFPNQDKTGIVPAHQQINRKSETDASIVKHTLDLLIVPYQTVYAVLPMKNVILSELLLFVCARSRLWLCI